MSQLFDDISGGKWWKVDFHLHTPGSYDYGNGQEDEADQKKTTPKQYLKCCMEKNLDCIVVTDHNTVKWIPELRQALIEMRAENAEGFREIVIFPGIEISVMGNLHLLGIFDPSVDEENLYQILGKFDYANNTGSDDLKYTNKSFAEVMEVINKNKGIAIPAHVDKPCGLLRSEPTNLKAAFSETGILALEVTEATVTNQIYTESKLDLAYVLGSDSHNTRTIANHFTWVKMGAANIEALKLALYDAEDGAIRSIERWDNPNDISGRTYIRELTIENGRYIGRATPYTVSFSPWLTNLIGGRGTGKSSVLKFVRLLLQKGEELPDSLKKDFGDFASVPGKRSDLGMLVSDDAIKTTVTAKLVVDGVEHSLMWKEGETYELIQDTQEWRPAVALQDRFPMQMFSQKQLYEMTSDPELLFKYLDRKWDSDAWNEKVKKLRGDYCNVRREIRTLDEKKCRKFEIEAQLRDVKAKIAVFETDRTKVVLQEKNQLTDSKKQMHSIYSRYTPIIEIATNTNLILKTEPPFDLSNVDKQTKGQAEVWIAAMEAMQADILKVFEKYSKQCVSWDAFLSELNLNTLLVANNQAMDRLIEELRASGVDDIDKYAELLTLKERYGAMLADFHDIESQLEKCQHTADALVQQLEVLISERNEKRNAIVKSWNEIGPLQVTLRSMANVEKNAEAFRRIIRKDMEFGSEIFEEYENGTSAKGLIADIAFRPSLKEQLKALADVKKNLIAEKSDRYGKRFRAHLTRLFQQFPESAEEITMWIPEDKIELAINTGTKKRPAYKNIDAGSPGQRTSAILSLIFAVSNTPVIIDQPEDDLDTRNITTIVVDGIKEIKKNRQVILVTHNPNIVVNTNSEQVVQLDYRSGQICNACSGALQNHDVRDAICNVMEGGTEALKKRYYRIFKALEND
ncbi:TrlF family AAA-like ATPase [Pygmaiobacter massiliensis]|uniref:TrlF family AAA-like ATPase n=1 Tax=Pygmaiobacter massiliensis TaxID=1917873 RepID=UPI002A7F8F9E|nr:AAA family ATPase [Pygmaiobacter massiliensis]MDY4783389.1 AAA family ATPase [Pygmaiobacter massiliensis]